MFIRYHCDVANALDELFVYARQAERATLPLNPGAKNDYGMSTKERIILDLIITHQIECGCGFPKESSNRS